MDVYSIDQAHQTPYTVRFLFPTSHRTKLGHLFLALFKDSIFHGNADQFADGNHADNASLTCTILSTSWTCSSYITYKEIMSILQRLFRPSRENFCKRCKCQHLLRKYVPTALSPHLGRGLGTTTETGYSPLLPILFLFLSESSSCQSHFYHKQ